MQEYGGYQSKYEFRDYDKRIIDDCVSKGYEIISFKQSNAKTKYTIIANENQLLFEALPSYSTSDLTKAVDINDRFCSVLSNG